MKDHDSLFDAAPEGLDRLVSRVLEGIEPEPVSSATGPFGQWTEQFGGQIGPYKLLSTLGEGGMGTVYLAEQTQPIKRQVALKVIKPGMDTAQVIARFEAERQALAVLDHPNISRVFDARATAGGRPYFVMELVTGLSITKYCDEHTLSIEDRLTLFLQVCEAVQHAHQKGIIHRDIKPSNILVSMQGHRAVPKIIDFGIAKAVTQPLTERTLYTEQGQFVGTPEYMSPEQAESTAQGVDTRTDIYSLGVVLYELLTGMLPFDAETLRQGGAEYIRRVIREEDPKTPSTRLNGVAGDTSTKVAALRRTDRRSLGRALHGDLDWITLKAMDKDPDRRYATAHALAQDIQRHLKHEPVTAGSPGMVYRTQKFVRRHRRRLVAMLGVVILVSGLQFSLMILRTGLDQSREADMIQHENTLSEAKALGDRGEYQAALSTVGTLLHNPHLGPRARLLRARLLMLKLQSIDVPIMANDAQWMQVMEALEGLLGESDEVAGQAHFLLATIYYESDPEAIAGTSEYDSQWVYHQQKADALLPETADSYLLRAISAATGHQILQFLDKALTLDPGHFESVKARATVYQASANYFEVAMDATLMKSIKPNDPQGYALGALALRELGKFNEALADHDKAIELSPDDASLVEQRCQTYMHMGQYAPALEDARACMRLEPSVNLYQMRVFFALVALGQIEQAAGVYETLSAAYNFDKFEFDDWATHHVFDTLAAKRSWYPSDTMPTGKAFVPMCLADAAFRRFPEKATRLIRQAAFPCFSPDGSKLAYTLGTPKSTGIAVYDMDTGQSQLLVLPGKRPVWSPDGHSIAYIRNRQSLPFSSLVRQRSMKGSSDWQDNIQEIWMIKAHGKEAPHFVAKGYGAAWSSDSKRVIYHSPTDPNNLYEKSIDPQVTASNPSPVPIGLISPDGAYEALRSQGLGLVDSTTRAVLGSWPGLKVHSLNWSPDRERPSLLVGGKPDIWHNNACVGGLWFCDVMSQSLSRVFQDYAFGDAIFSPDPAASQLVFALNNQKTVWYSEIWMADLSPDDLRMAQTEACQTVARHHQDIIQSQYDRSIDMDPNEPLNYLLRGARYLKLQDIEKALMDVENFARIEQDRQLRHDSYLNRRLEYIMSGQRFLLNLVNPLTKVSGDLISQDSPGRRGLAWSFFYQGLWAQRGRDYETALARYRASIRIDPALAAAFHKLAIIQATCPVPQWHAPGQALENAARACELTGWTDVAYIETYAAAAVRAGDFNAAVKWQQEALDQMGAEGDRGLAAQAQAKLDLYQQKKTYQQQYLWPKQLVAWWPFDQDDTQQVRDHSGHNLHGRFMGDANVVPDQDRGAVLSLDGKGDFVDCGRDCRFNLTESITLCAWIKPRVFNKKHQALISNGDKGWNLNRQAYANGIQIVGYGVQKSEGQGSLWADLAGQKVIADGHWHHLVGVYDGAQLRLYVDGQLDVECKATGRIRSNDWPVFIGENSEETNREWNGLIDDVRIYSYALTLDEIKGLYGE